MRGDSDVCVVCQRPVQECGVMRYAFQAKGLVKRFGKTTTIRILLGLLRADAGTARLLEGDPWRDAAVLHRRLAYVPGDVNLWPTLTGGEVQPRATQPVGGGR